MSFSTSQAKRVLVLWYHDKRVDLLIPKDDVKKYPKAVLSITTEPVHKLRAGGPRSTCSSASKTESEWTIGARSSASLLSHRPGNKGKCATGESSLETSSIWSGPRAPSDVSITKSVADARSACQASVCKTRRSDAALAKPNVRSVAAGNPTARSQGSQKQGRSVCSSRSNRVGEALPSSLPPCLELLALVNFLHAPRSEKPLTLRVMLRARICQDVRPGDLASRVNRLRRHPPKPSMPPLLLFTLTAPSRLHGRRKLNAADASGVTARSIILKSHRPSLCLRVSRVNEPHMRTLCLRLTMVSIFIGSVPCAVWRYTRTMPTSCASPVLPNIRHNTNGSTTLGFLGKNSVPLIMKTVPARVRAPNCLHVPATFFEDIKEMQQQGIRFLWWPRRRGHCKHLKRQSNFIARMRPAWVCEKCGATSLEKQAAIKRAKVGCPLKNKPSTFSLSKCKTLLKHRISALTKLRGDYCKLAPSSKRRAAELLLFDKALECFGGFQFLAFRLQIATIN